MTARYGPDEWLGHGGAAWLVAGLLWLAVLAVYAIRVVPRDERLVVFRRDAAVRTRGPGLAVVWPGERAERVPAADSWVDVQFLDATTADGIAESRSWSTRTPRAVTSIR